MILGPTYAEMRDPSLRGQTFRNAVRDSDRLDPIRLHDIRWVSDQGRVRSWVVPPALTGVDAPIALILGNGFPTGAHKVGAAYCCVIEDQLSGLLTPGEHTLVFPSTGNYGIGGAWVGPRMGYRSLVVLPEEMSAERFEMIRSLGAEVTATPGCESNVKEIYDEVWRLKQRPEIRVLNQFEAMGNYRFHRGVTGPAVEKLAVDLGYVRVAAFVSAMGSGGTIAAGDHLKKAFGTAIVGLEPTQCPTLFNAGYGGHRIEGIGDKHVTWVHNTLNMDLLCCIDDHACVTGLQLLQEGSDVVAGELGLSPTDVAAWKDNLGVSGLCNLIGAIKTAKALQLGRDDLIVTVATDGFDRYPSVMRDLDARVGPQTRETALRRLGALQSIGTDWVQEGTAYHRRRWHNQKYYTWVEQQQRSIEDLEALTDQAFWEAQAARIPEIDAQILAARGA
jgi:cysteine synthase